MPANSSFGRFFSAIFFVAFIYFYLKGLSIFSGILFFFAIFLLISSLYFPLTLEPFNRLWFRFGLLLGKIVSPIVLGAIFFGVITPVALIGRLFGRDPLRLRMNQSSSYWIERSMLDSESFKNQF